MSTPNDTKLKDGLTLVSLVVRILSLVEKLLPAFLVAWNNELRNKNKSLEIRLDHEKLKQTLETNHDKPLEDPKAVIDQFLDRNTGHGPGKDPNPR